MSDRAIARLEAEIARLKAEIAMLRASLRMEQDGRTVDRLNAEAIARLPAAADQGGTQGQDARDRDE